ncbi:MAG: sigma factor-like helix-turn-helix DNA-binding protein, partial [Burkholderiales bacterium]
DDRAARSWLYTILRNEHARLYERKRIDVADGADLDSIADPRLTDLCSDLEMHEALHKLPGGYREPLLLQVLGGFSCEEIAEVMHLSSGAVMTRLSRARMELRRLCGPADQGKKDTA